MNTILLNLAALLIVVIASGRPARDMPDAYDLDDIGEALRSTGYGWAMFTAACVFVVASLIVLGWALWSTAQTAKTLAVIAFAFAWHIDRLTLNQQRDEAPPELTTFPA